MKSNNGDNSEDLIIREQMRLKKFEDLPEVGNLPSQLQGLFMNAKAQKWNIHVNRILFVLLLNVKSNQTQNKSQLDLFDEDWYDVTKDTLSSKQMNFFYKDFLPDNYNNYEGVKEGLQMLLNYRGKNEFTVGNTGRTIKVHGGIISDYIEDNYTGGVKLTMNAYWYKKFLDISNFNPFIKDAIFKLSSVTGQMMYVFLKSLKHISNDSAVEYSKVFGQVLDRPKGTQMKLETINEKFLTNYKSWSKCKEKMLDPIRSDLNSHSEISFNYKIAKNKCYIITYSTKHSVPTLYDSEVLKTKKAIYYRKREGNLDEVSTIMLFEIYVKYGYGIIYSATTRKPVLKGLKGQKLVEEIHKLVISYIEKNKIEEWKFRDIGKIREAFGIKNGVDVTKYSKKEQ